MTAPVRTELDDFGITRKHPPLADAQLSIVLLCDCNKYTNFRGNVIKRGHEFVCRACGKTYKIGAMRRKSVAIPERVKPRAPDPEIMALSQKFVSLTGIPWADPKTKGEWAKAAKLWIAPLREMIRLSNGRSEAILAEAVRQMRKDGLTIYAPASVEKVFVSIYGEKHKNMDTQAARDPFAGLHEMLERQANENHR